MEMNHAIALVRRDIGDPAETFVTDTFGDGMTTLIDLPPQNVNPVGLVVKVVAGAGTTTVLPTVVPGSASIDNPSGTANFPAWSSATAYSAGALVSYQGSYYQALNPSMNVIPSSSTYSWGSPLMVYTLDGVNGMLQFNIAPLNQATIFVTGQSWGMFSDQDLESVIWDAVDQHCFGQNITERYRTYEGFITYRETAKTLSNLPKMEETLVITLADINAMWILATDAATDVNVSTAEGTSIDRSARYQQIMEHIQNLREKYELWCGQLGVGMFRIETLNLRRVSYTNNRLVPIFRDREYDDHRYPVRELPTIDSRDQDNSGVPSPVWNGLPI